MTIKERVQALREKMKASGVAMYVVPSTDCHESEYVSELLSPVLPDLPVRQ